MGINDFELILLFGDFKWIFAIYSWLNWSFSVNDHVNLEVIHKRRSDRVGSSNDDFINTSKNETFDFQMKKYLGNYLDITKKYIPVSQNRQNPFMQIHDGIIRTFVLIDNRIGVKSNNQKVSLKGSLFQKVQVTNVEKVKSSGYVDNPALLESISFVK